MTTWAEGAIQPVRAAVGEVLPAERPELREALSAPPPADRVQTPALLAAWLTGLGLTGVGGTPAPLQVPLDAAVVRARFEGTALRALLDGLDPDRREDLLGRITEAALRRGDTLDATALVAVGTVP